MMQSHKHAVYWKTYNAMCTHINTMYPLVYSYNQSHWKQFDRETGT